jgi:hypothetical protein
MKKKKMFFQLFFVYYNKQSIQYSQNINFLIMSQIPSKNELTKPKSALDVAVNQLVRASVGGVPSTISDESLDKYVADLILKEAAAKNKQYNKEGVKAYLPHTET